MCVANPILIHFMTAKLCCWHKIVKLFIIQFTLKLPVRPFCPYHLIFKHLLVMFLPLDLLFVWLVYGSQLEERHVGNVS